MIEVLPSYLAVVDGGKRGWLPAARRQFASGTNFIQVLADTPAAREQLGRELDVLPDELPPSMPRSRLLSLSPFIDPQDFDRLWLALEEGMAMLFIEQLDLSATQPPRVKPYLLCCPVRGILSQHDDAWGAEAAWADHAKAGAGQPRYPAAAVYHWQGTSWGHWSPMAGAMWPPD